MSGRGVLALVGALGLTGCPPTNLLKATTDFSKMTESAATDLGAAPGLVSNLCLLRAEIEYLTKRVEPGQQLTTFEAFYSAANYPIDLPGARTITWKQQCLAYHLADETFSKAVKSISDYGAALGGFASGTVAPGSDMKDMVKSTADGVSQISTTVKPFKTALEGVGAPLAVIADAVATEWKAKALKKLIDKTDKPLQDAIGNLEAFVKVLHDEQMRDLREALATLLAETKLRDANPVDYVIVRLEKLVAEMPREDLPTDEHPRADKHPKNDEHLRTDERLRAEAHLRAARETLTALVEEMKLHDRNRVKIDLLSGAMLDVTISEQLAQFDRQLAALDDLLHKLADAHAKLKAGWDAGEDVGLDTIKSVGTLAKDVYSDVKAFENPGKVGG